MNVVIIGGGYLGQLLHTLLPEARVLDWRPAPPTEMARQFGPQYLWRPITALPFREFNVITHVDDAPAQMDAVRRYKEKVGKVNDRGDWAAQFRSAMKGYEVTLPPCRVEFGMRVDKVNVVDHRLTMGNGEVIKYDWLISTIPLPSLLSLAGMSTDELNPFESRPIYLWTRPHVQLSYLYVNYISDNRTPVYRQTTRDGRMHFESLEPVMPDDGVKVHRLLPGKIYSNSLTAVYRAELRMQHVLTVGRYGAWNPDELAHETYFEVQSWLQLVS